MSANASLVVNNHAAVAKTFTVEDPGLNSGNKTWAEKTAGVHSQYTRLSLKTSLGSAKRATNRQDFATDLPLIRTVNSVPTVIGHIRIITQVIDPVDATQSEINDAFAFHFNGLDSTLIKGQIRDRDFIAG